MHVTYYLHQLLEPEMNSSERITVDTCITGKKKLVARCEPVFLDWNS